MSRRRRSIGSGREYAHASRRALKGEGCRGNTPLPQRRPRLWPAALQGQVGRRVAGGLFRLGTQAKDPLSFARRCSKVRQPSELKLSMTSDPRLVWNLKADLGEGPVWVERDAALWFVDIKRQKIYRFDPESGEQRGWDAPEQVGFVLPAASGGFIAGLQSGLRRFDPHSGAFSLIGEVDADLPDNRLNDGVVDPAGRVWFGTMDNGERAKNGAFYCFDRGELKRTHLTGISITNGPAISPDGDRLYWVDTIPGTISACDIGVDGELGPSREIVRIPAAEGHPDGPT